MTNLEIGHIAKDPMVHLQRKFVGLLKAKEFIKNEERGD